MAKLIFRLNGVGEDEAEEVRELFTAHDIAYYETEAGLFGISLPAIWLPDESQHDSARQLLDEYQVARRERIQSELAQAREEGTLPTVFSRFLADPLRFLLIVGVIGAILYFSLMPFLTLH